MKLVFIHGRDQQGKDPAALKQLWIDTWKAGLAKNNVAMPGDLDIVFPFYGDELDRLVKQFGIAPDIENAVARGGEPEGDLVFMHDFLTELAEKEGVTEADIIAEFEGNIQERGPLNWKWVRAIMKALDKTKLGSLAIKQFTYDVYLYLTIPGIRRRIDDFVIALLDGGPCVVVGHSLGSVIGYNILGKNPAWFVRKYITLGSPLGVRSVRQQLATPLAMPACVKNGWYNAFDGRDAVALQALDSTHFDITPSIENYAGVKNHTDNRHGIEGYLDDKEIARVIGEQVQVH